MVAPTTCNVYGTLLYPTGDPVVDNDIEMFVECGSNGDLPQFAQGSLLTGKSVVLHTGENGYFESPMIRGALVTLHLKRSNFKCQFEVPDVESIDIKDIPGVHGEIKTIENPF